MSIRGHGLFKTQTMRNIIRIVTAVAYYAHALWSVFRPRFGRDSREHNPDYYNHTDEQGNSQNEESK